MLVQSIQKETKELVVTDDVAVLCFPRQEDEDSLAPCCPEEAALCMDYTPPGVEKLLGTSVM